MKLLSCTPSRLTPWVFLVFAAASTNFNAGLTAQSPNPPQLTLGMSGESRTLADAMDLYNKAQYAQALKAFDGIVRDAGNRAGAATRSSEIEAEFRAAMCALYLYHKDAVLRVDRFVRNHPGSSWTLKARWEVADYQYRRKKFGPAIAAFNQIEPRALPKDKRGEYRFKRGHSHFEKGDLDAARRDLLPVVEGDETGESGPQAWKTAAHYYLAHIAYREQRLNTALDGFRSLLATPEFTTIVPLYIAQILYQLEQYAEAVQFIPPHVAADVNVAPDARASMQLILGKSLYQTSDYAGALPNLEAAWERASAVERTTDLGYMLGMTRKSLGDFDGAVQAFFRATGGADALEQLATYHMAQCYLANNEKERARTAFRKASEYDFNSEVAEDALFNYAKLAFEAKYNPFDDAITAFEDYIKAYPNSPRHDEAYGFLMEVYLTSRQSDRALDALDKIKRMPPATEAAYQRIAFNRGVDLFQQGEMAACAALFERSRLHPMDASLAAESHYWQGEAAYSRAKYALSLSHFNAFLSAPGAFGSTRYNQGEYGAGYALFKQRKYRDALTAFRKYVYAVKGKAEGKEKGRLADANLRIGDCFYLDKDYTRAIDHYATAVQGGVREVEYASYQKAVCLGLDGQQEEEIVALRDLLNRWPETSYRAVALTEIGHTELGLDRPARAKVAFEQLLEENPESPYVKGALVDLTLISIKQGDPEGALDLWKQISTTYPNDQATADAFLLVEPLLIERGRLGEVPASVGLTGDDIEMKMFGAARDMAISGDCSEGKAKLHAFLSAYPDGRFSTAAHFHLGQCSFQSGEADALDALNDLEWVINAPLNDYTEEALLLASTLRFNAADFSIALEHYLQLERVAVLKSHVLEARIGVLRCSREMGDSERLLAYADPIIADPGTPDAIRTQAHYERGLLRASSGEAEGATADFEAVLSAGGPDAEGAAFGLAALAEDREDWLACQDLVFAQLNRFGGQSAWAHKGFLLLARSYIGQGDLFQARATLEAILKNVEVPDVRAKAMDALDRITQLENPPPMEDPGQQVLDKTVDQSDDQGDEETEKQQP